MTETGAEPVARVRELGVRVDGRALVAGVSFTAAAGSVTALVGPSGSGKTTTALSLLGEWPPGADVTGHVRVAGVDVLDGEHRAGERDLARLRGGTVAYLPQDSAAALNPARRVGSTLRELAAVHRPPGGRRRERAAALRASATEALRMAALPDGADTVRRFPHRFSGGQRQRVVLAQTLVCRPRLLVLDEPTTGLDAATKLGVLDTLRGLAETGLAVVLLSHDPVAVDALADTVVRLDPDSGGRTRTAVSGHRARLAAEARTGPPAGTASAGSGTARTAVSAGSAAPVSTPMSAAPMSAAATSAAATSTPPAGTAAAHTGAPGRTAASPLPADRVPLLAVRGLRAEHRSGRRRVTAVDGADLELAAGTVTGLIGASGSGKTTLARCIAGLHAPAAGTVELAGRALPPLARRGTEEVRRVQYVWQEVLTSFDADRPVDAQVARTAVRLRGLARAEALAEARALLAGLGVDGGTAERTPGRVSGGELQRAALARALLARPDVLVCDEVTTALDAERQADVLADLCAAAVEGGTALLLISHDLALVAEYAERVAVMDCGRIVEKASPDTLIAAPATGPSRTLVAASGLQPMPRS